jgi:HEAT repeat protein
VLGECFASLLTMEPEAGLDLVAEQLLSTDDAVAEAAAVALGESRLDEAFEPLSRALETSRGRDRRRALLLGLALLRRDRAIDQLVAIVAEGSGSDPADALEALRIYRNDSTLHERLNDIVDRSGDRALARTLAETFSP